MEHSQYHLAVADGLPHYTQLNLLQRRPIRYREMVLTVLRSVKRDEGEDTMAVLSVT